ncbi:unnamed protein product [Vicia faba]|uniref:Uncharacterized protein n=1 Tax=Vicia faba TaxID=3906 RepID=A0AAV0YRG9_VICFA|nr:unnamed protein product [Vicia faba]
MLVDVAPPTGMVRILLHPFQPDSRGETSSGTTRNVGILSDSQWLSHMSSPPAPALLVRLGHCTLKEDQASTSEKDCSYLDNLIDEALDEELLSFSNRDR